MDANVFLCFGFISVYWRLLAVTKDFPRKHPLLLRYSILNSLGVAPNPVAAAQRHCYHNVIRTRYTIE